MSILTWTRMETLMKSDLSRRMFLGTALAGGVVSLVPVPALALGDAQATQLVDRVVADINKVIARGGSLSSMISQFERIFSNYADVPIIARSALGVDARRASSGQLNAYTRAFKSYIARKYGKRLRNSSAAKSRSLEPESSRVFTRCRRR